MGDAPADPNHISADCLIELAMLAALGGGASCAEIARSLSTGRPHLDQDSVERHGERLRTPNECREKKLNPFMGD